MKIESGYLHIFLKYVPFFVSVWVLGLNQKPGFVGRLILKVPKFKAYIHSCSMDRKENLKRLKSLQQGQFKRPAAKNDTSENPGCFNQS